jgi:tRNA (adenine22-N1)-methyltransferase
MRTLVGSSRISAMLTPDSPPPPSTPNSSLAQAPAVRRLSLRLQHLYRVALNSGPYDQIWDLCCDHGRLGLHLYRALTQTQQRTCVHLVDCVPSIIEPLHNQYAGWIGANLQIACMDAGDIHLAPGNRQLIILAGIAGGIYPILEKIIGRMTAMDFATAGSSVEFLLSPNLNMFELRQFLRQFPLELIDEEFIEEKGQGYEHLHLRYHFASADFNKPTLIGDRLWCAVTPSKKHYLTKLITHYQTCASLGGQEHAKLAAAQYAELLSKMA